MSLYNSFQNSGHLQAKWPRVRKERKAEKSFMGGEAFLREWVREMAVRCVRTWVIFAEGRDGWGIVDCRLLKRVLQSAVTKEQRMTTTRFEVTGMACAGKPLQG